MKIEASKSPAFKAGVNSKSALNVVSNASNGIGV
jgi:hypothetical protein